MTIYVDPPFNYGKKGLWSHMMSDSDDLTELHEMAQKIGLKRSWFQNHASHPHYDLRPSKQKLAIRYGAIELPTQKIVKIRNERN